MGLMRLKSWCWQEAPGENSSPCPFQLLPTFLASQPTASSRTCPASSFSHLLSYFFWSQISLYLPLAITFGAHTGSFRAIQDKGAVTFFFFNNVFLIFNLIN